MPSIVILDVDGTLVDTNYQHTLGWYRAFLDNGVVVPAWRVHRHMGMGGDMLVAAVAGDEVEEAKGDDIRESEERRYQELIGEVQVLEGARGWIERLKAEGLTVVMASSGKGWEVDHYLDLLDGRDLLDDWTTSADAEESKPKPDVIEVALEKVGGGDAVLVGDSIWDCEAAKRAGVPCWGVLTGGFSESELLGAGAKLVASSVVDLTLG